MSNHKHPDLHLSAKGVCARSGQILLIEYRNSYDDGTHFNIPGGRVRKDESVREAVKRKFMEEAGTDVLVGSFMFAYEYIGSRMDHIRGDSQSVSLVFQCEDSGRERVEPTRPDTALQLRAGWYEIRDLGQMDLVPQFGERLMELLTTGRNGDPFWGLY